MKQTENDQTMKHLATCMTLSNEIFTRMKKNQPVTATERRFCIETVKFSLHLARTRLDLSS